MRTFPSVSVRWAAGIPVALFATALTAQAQQGRVTVRVTDAANQQPVAQAQVQLVGTTLGGLTGLEGRFTIRGVPAGTHQVRVLRVGYGEQKKQVEVAGDQEATVDFAISAVAISLTPVVTTATGEQRRVELGNSVAQLDASKIAQETPIRGVEDMFPDAGRMDSTNRARAELMTATVRRELDAGRARIRRALPGARVVEIPGGSHAIFRSHTAQVLEEMGAFLMEAERGREE